MSLNKILSALIVVSFVSGCAASAKVDADKGIKSNKETVKELSSLVTGQYKEVSKIKGVNRFWVSTKIVKDNGSRRLKNSWMNTAPAFFNLGSLDLKDALSALKIAYPQLKFSINEDVFMSSSFSSGGLGDSGQSQDTGGQGDQGQSQGSSASSVSNYPTEVKMLYNGNLAGLIDRITSDIDVFWSIDKDDKNKINFNRFALKTFKLNVISGVSDSASGMSLGGSGSSSGSSSSNSSSSSSSSGSSGSSGSSSGGGATMTTSFSSQSDPFTEVVKNIRAVLSSKGTLVSMQGFGSITVRDTPYYLDKISNIVEEFNKSMTSQIVLDVKVYSLKKVNSDNYGVNWELFYKSVRNKFSIALLTVPPASVGAGVLTSTVLNPNSPWVGTKSIVEALSKLGNVSIVTETKAVTVDNIAIPISQSNSVSYIAEVTPSSIDANGSTILGAVTPGSVTTGFNMLVTPKIISNGNIMMQFAIDMSELTALVTRTSGGVSIQTPEISRNTFLQRAIIKSGQTLVMTGFNKKSLSSNDSGLGNSSNWLMGGSKSAKTVDEYLILVVTPKIVASFN